MTNKPPQTVSEREEIDADLLTDLRSAAESWITHRAEFMALPVEERTAPGVPEFWHDCRKAHDILGPETILRLLDLIALQAEGRRELVEALEPFAAEGRRTDSNPPDQGMGAWPRKDSYRVAVTLGDCRKARSALSKVVSGGGGQQNSSAQSYPGSDAQERCRPTPHSGGGGV